MSATVSLRNSYNKWHRDNIAHKSLAIPKQHVHLQKRIVRKLLSFDHGLSPKLLDVACGRGYLLEAAADKNITSYGIDISDVAVKESKKLVPQAMVLRADAQKLPFANNTFDFVTCLGSLEHFPDTTKAVKEMKRVLVPGGVCYLLVPNLMFVGHVYMTMRYGIMPTEGDQTFSEHERTFGDWQQVIEEAGLSVVKSACYNEIFSETKRVSFLTKFAWQRVLKHLVPFHFSYAFEFYCQKR